jgi:hypothetical protein
MPEPNATAFRLWTRLTKALPNADSGEIRHGGVFHDESLDLEGDVVTSEMLAKSLGYLGTHGKHNWNHHTEDIGDVLSVLPIDTTTALRDFGVNIVNRGTALEGTVYPLVDPALASADLKAAHHRFGAVARLGYSMDGMCSRDHAGQLRAVLVPQVAICPQPINASTVCKRLAKGFAEVAATAQMTDVDLPSIMRDLEQAPDILVDMSAPGGAAQMVPAQVVISNELFGHLIRKAFNRWESPPLGGVWRALQKQQDERPLGHLRKAFDALRSG